MALVARCLAMRLAAPSCPRPSPTLRPSPLARLQRLLLLPHESGAAAPPLRTLDKVCQLPHWFRAPACPQTAVLSRKPASSGLCRCAMASREAEMRSPDQSNNQYSGGVAMRAMQQGPAPNWQPQHEDEDHQPLAGGVKSDDYGGAGGGQGHGGGGGGGGEGQGEPHSGGQRPLHPILAWYMKMLEERPVTTKAITSAILTFIGDLFTQLVIEKSGGIDVKRIAVITSLGFLLVGPTLHFWYLALSKVVKFGGPKGAGVRLMLDQLVFSPIFIGVFFISLLTMEGRPSDIGPKLSQDWPSAVVTNWKIWVPFQFVNFLFVPQQLQVAFANVISLAWNAYLSFATHTEVDSKSD